MTLEEQINADIKTAMLAREKEKLEALRAIKSAVLLEKTKEGASGVTQEAELKLLQRLVKQRKEAAEVYASQNRTELADSEIFQANIIEKYLPAQMGNDELADILKKIIAETGASSVKDMGKVMGIATKQLAGKADNKAISDIIKKLLS
ncbi:MAG TPA: GatB/YqeY domain-containing protein [Bacteroidales bacterium]|nr:GatB/YqeY domain-containing protein [Bacteroidales bacterium]HPT03522.1 GatB/YqeY domain-containing protein [Bacteroidales bacterium]